MIWVLIGTQDMPPMGCKRHTFRASIKGEGYMYLVQSVYSGGIITDTVTFVIDKKAP